ncbi:hypothetical protein ABC977_04210 [Thioalkalicoccus limnaeus]|uniref:Uncharacterized protein n=1 Tax=Thioalkalicoccus limnaeus TaxID=120681 RepID=A0ABV4BEB3_9GAMM
MRLNAIVGDLVYTLEVPDTLIAEADDFFARLDRDMDHGWQMSREWVPRPTRLERCQIVADKLLTTLENEDDQLGRLMAGYILSRLPDVAAVEPDLEGEIQNTRFQFNAPQTDPAPAQQAATDRTPRPRTAGPGLDKFAAMAQAGQEVTQVFKVGKGYRFSVYDPASGRWLESPQFVDRNEAERLRQMAFKDRFESLQQGSAPADQPRPRSHLG